MSEQKINWRDEVAEWRRLGFTSLACDRYADAMQLLEKDSKDASRYRFLRDNADSSNEPFVAIKGPGGISQWTGEMVDQAVDYSQLSRMEKAAHKG